MSLDNQMAASSKNPPCCHEDLNSIFLNAETVLFLHQVATRAHLDCQTAKAIKIYQITLLMYYTHSIILLVTIFTYTQIFLKGLTARMDSWPTLVLGTSLGTIIWHLAEYLLLITASQVEGYLLDHLDIQRHYKVLGISWLVAVISLGA